MLSEVFRVSTKTTLVHLGLEHVLKGSSTFFLNIFTSFILIEMLCFQMNASSASSALSPVWTRQHFFVDGILKNFVHTNKMNVLFRLAMANLSEMQKKSK